MIGKKFSMPGNLLRFNKLVYLLTDWDWEKIPLEIERKVGNI